MKSSAMNSFEVTPRTGAREVFGIVGAAVGLEMKVMRRDVVSLADRARAAMSIALINMFPCIVPNFEKRQPCRPKAGAQESNKRNIRPASRAELRFDIQPIFIEFRGYRKFERFRRAAMLAPDDAASPFSSGARVTDICETTARKSSPL